MHADNADAPVIKRRRMLPHWLALLALGFAFLLLVPWLQRAFWLTQCPGQIRCDTQWYNLSWTPAVETFLSIGVILVVAAIAGVAVVDRVAAKIVSYIAKNTNWWTAVTVVAAILLPLSLAYFVLDRFPNSGDEYCYLFEAHTLAGFRLWETPPILGTNLIPFRTWIFDSKWVSQAPPGWPMVLAGGLLLGIPTWMMNALLGGGSVAALVALCRRVGDRSTTVVAVALFTLTPFYIMNAASYFPHVLSSLLILLFCFCLLPEGEIVRSHKLVAAGAIVGMLLMTRYFDVLPLLPAFLFWLVTQRRKAWPRILGLMVAGFTPFLMLLMIYQYLITGNPFRSSYSVINTPEVSEAFVNLDPSRIANEAILVVVVSLIRLAELVLWTSPILVIAYCCCVLRKLKDRKLAYYDLIFPSFLFAYTVLADPGGNRYGPRYYFGAFPLMMVTIVSALPLIKARLKRPIDRTMLPLGSIVCLLYLFGTAPLVLAGFRLEVFSRQEPFRVATQVIPGNAIVILDTSAAGLHVWDLVRNPPSMNAALLYARSGTDIGALRNAFPERSIWQYSRYDTTQPGQLIRIMP
ncbi:glycosyltransferase family 39 protein [Bradyrhizobium sp. OAE829]|uniref:glycosyltransferase family 39 protein n=1 Tax=Bradyrhizobium sp. OAE829 TaxID=2663807 RepID=UPI00178B1ABC